MDYGAHIANVPDFPKPGIQFKDITTLMANGEVFAAAIDEMTEFAKEVGAEVIVGPEARGFIFGCPVAANLKIGFIPVRKPGKLPRETVSYHYDLEYGSNTLCMHKDAIIPGQKVLIVDDLLATGGTMIAAIKLVEELGGEVAGLIFLNELAFLEGREHLAGYKLKTLSTF